MMRFPPLPRPASDAAPLLRARRVAGYFSSTATAALVMLGATSIAGAQDWTGAAGDNDYGTAGNWDPAAVPGAGDDVTVDVDVDVNVNAPFAANSLLQSSGLMTVTSTGALAITNTAEFRQQSALQIDTGGTFAAGSMTVRNSATVDVDGALTTGSMTVRNAATVNVNAGGTLAAPTEVLGTGSLDVNAGGTLDGDLLMAGVTPNPAVTIAQDGTLTGTATVNRGTLVNNGEIQGGLDTTGGNSTVTVTIGADGSVDGAVTHGAGTLTNAGTLSSGLSVGNGTTATIQSGGTVTGGTTVTLGTLNIDAGGEIDDLTLNGGDVNNDGEVDGAATVNSGEFTTTGTINGDVALNGGAVNAENAISGEITTTGGTFTTTGALTHTGVFFANSGRVDVAGGDLTTGGTFANNGDLTLSGADLNVGGLFTNTDRVILDDGRAFTAASVANSGFIGLGAGTPGLITATINGPVTGSAGSRLDLQNAVAGDSMVIQGGLSGVNTLALDIDLTTANAGFADILSVNGAVDGDLAIALNPITNNGALTLQTTPITLVDGNTLGGALNASLSGPLATNGLIVYRLTEDAGAGDIGLQSGINPAIGSVAGAFSSVQSLVSTVVNRPSGAYVSGIAFDAPKNCSTGTWARVTGGRTETNTTSENSVINRSETSRGSLNYGGFQGGADFGCFEAFDGGWDISGGILAGYNQGEFDERSAGLLTTGDFDQYFIGGYVAAAKGNWSGELQLRYANADFTFNNTALDLRDASDDVDSYSLSGSMTYRFDLREGLALLPTVGFAVTDNESASLTFRNASGGELGRLKVDSHTSKTTFLGATLSQTTINEAAATATNAFITGTYYFDNSGSRDSTFTLADGTSGDVSTSEIGDFGEISVGGSYVRVLGTSPGQVRQINYGVRVDARFGDDVEGVGLTGQIRLQF